ncbi:hypothetical protein SKPI104516_01570 [Skermania piniformis]
MRKLVAAGLLSAALIVPAVTVSAPLAAADPVAEYRVPVLEVDPYLLAQTIANISGALFTPQSAEFVGSIGAAVGGPILDFTADLLQPR